MHESLWKTEKLCVDCKHANANCPINQRLEPGQPCACYAHRSAFPKSRNTTHGELMQMHHEAENPMSVQVGGAHYKELAIQPMEYSMANKLDACQHTIIKYVTRFRAKGGIQDLEKARHCLDMLIAFEKKAGK